MSATAVTGYLFGAICLLASIYVGLSRDLMRVTIAFFVELAALGVVLLTLNADYLALVVLAVAVLGTVLVISFSSIILGSLKDSFKREAESGKGLLTRLFGMALGLGLGAAIGWAFFTGPAAGEMPPPESPAIGAGVLGRMMLGEQIVVLELLAMMVLVVVVGTGLLLRKPDDAN